MVLTDALVDGLGSRVARSRASIQLFGSIVDGVPVGSSPAWPPENDMSVEWGVGVVQEGLRPGKVVEDSLSAFVTVCDSSEAEVLRYDAEILMLRLGRVGPYIQMVQLMSWRHQPQHQYLRVITEYFCLWRVTHSDESAQAILYHFPGPQALLHHPHPPFYWHVIFWRSSGAAADRHTIYDRAKQLDRSSGSRHPRTKTVHQRVSQHHMTVPSTSTLATPRKRQQQSRIAGHPDHTTDVRKNRENVDLHIT